MKGWSQVYIIKGISALPSGHVLLSQLLPTQPSCGTAILTLSVWRHGGHAGLRGDLGEVTGPDMVYCNTTLYLTHTSPCRLKPVRASLTPEVCPCPNPHTNARQPVLTLTCCPCYALAVPMSISVRRHDRCACSEFSSLASHFTQFTPTSLHSVRSEFSSLRFFWLSSLRIQSWEFSSICMT